MDHILIAQRTLIEAACSYAAVTLIHSQVPEPTPEQTAILADTASALQRAATDYYTAITTPPAPAIP